MRSKLASTVRAMLLTSLSALLIACGQTPRQEAEEAPLPNALLAPQDSLQLTDGKMPIHAAVDEGHSAASIPVRQCTPESGVAWSEPQHENIWDRIRYGYSLNLFFDHPRISAELDWFGSQQKYIDRVTDRAAPYLYYVVEALEKQQLPLEIALLPIVESAYDPFAYSHGKAAGMWQFISSTGELYGLKQNWWYDGRRDIRASTQAAAAYLSHLARHYHGDWELALAAYNTGQGNVDRAIRRNRKKGLPIDFWSLKLPRETRAYVPRLLAVARIIADPSAYGVKLDHIPNEPYFGVVDIGSQIDLAEAAELADITIAEMYRLNPGFNRWATDPRGPFELLIPLPKCAPFTENLSQQASGNRVDWRHYQVAAGDSLSLIAKRHNTSIDAIAQANQLSDSTIYAGRTLLIPMSGHTAAASNPDGLASDDAQRIEYRVRPGDSLWKIARQHKVSERKIRQWNGLESDAPLLAGSQLILWHSPNAHSQPSTKAPPAPYIRKVGYTVRRGDTLSEIASKFNVVLSDVRKWNAMGQPTKLLPGQRLTLYVDITKAN